MGSRSRSRAATSIRSFSVWPTAATVEGRRVLLSAQPGLRLRSICSTTSAAVRRGRALTWRLEAIAAYLRRHAEGVGGSGDDRADAQRLLTAISVIRDGLS